MEKRGILKKKLNLERILVWGAAAAVLLSLSYLALISIFATVQIDHSESAVFCQDSPFMHLLFLALFLLALLRLHSFLSRCSARAFLVILLVFLFSIGNWMVFTWKVEPVADQGTVLSAAQAFARGDFTMLDRGGYLYLYPHQLGLVAYFQLVNLFAGTNTYLVLQVLNIFALSACYFLLLGICRILFAKREVEILLLLFLFSAVQPLLYLSFVYGNLIGLAAGLAGIWLQLRYLEEGKKKLAFGSSAFLALSIALKNNHLIFLVASVLIYLADAAWKRRKSSILFALVPIAANLLLGGTIRFGYEQASGREIAEGMPKVLWVAMGMQEGPRASGWYNEYTLDLYQEVEFDAKRARQEAQQEIRQRLKEFAEDPLEAFSFYYRKTASMWNNPDFQGFWVNLDNRPSNIWGSELGNSLFLGRGRDVLSAWMNLHQSLIYLGATAYLVLFWKTHDFKMLFLAIIFLGGFLFHLFWEAKGQYALTYFLLLFPYAAAGWIGAAKKVRCAAERLFRHSSRAKKASEFPEK